MNFATPSPTKPRRKAPGASANTRSGRGGGRGGGRRDLGRPTGSKNKKASTSKTKTKKPKNGPITLTKLTMLTPKSPTKPQKKQQSSTFVQTTIQPSQTKTYFSSPISTQVSSISGLLETMATPNAPPMRAIIDETTFRTQEKINTTYKMRILYRTQVNETSTDAVSKLQFLMARIFQYET